MTRKSKRELENALDELERNRDRRDEWPMSLTQLMVRNHEDKSRDTVPEAVR